MKSWDIELQQGKKANETKIITGSLPSQKAKRSKQKKKEICNIPFEKIFNSWLFTVSYY